MPANRYKPPVGKGPGRKPQIIKGWEEMAGIVTIRSGLPFSPTVNTDIANTGVGSKRAQAIGTPIFPKTMACRFYVAANRACPALEPNSRVALAGPAQYTYGHTRWNILRANTLQQASRPRPGVFPRGESRRLDFRGEFINVLNGPSFGQPGANSNGGSGGRSRSGSNAARVLQGACKLYF